jgi:alpha-glucosidase (family GH31 glycosyl hydrolase)
MAGLFFDYAQDQEIWMVPHQYMLGRSLLVCPVTEPDVTGWNVYLPEGDWIDFWDLTERQGRSWIKVEVPLNRIPIFITKGQESRIRELLAR